MRHERTTSTLDEFFRPSPFQCRVFDYVQEFDYAGAEGRLLSSSYAPGPGQPNHDAMLRELRRIVDVYQEGGRVAVHYNTRLYFGRLA